MGEVGLVMEDHTVLNVPRSPRVLVVSGGRGSGEARRCRRQAQIAQGRERHAGGCPCHVRQRAARAHVSTSGRRALVVHVRAEGWSSQAGFFRKWIQFVSRRSPEGGW